MSKVSNTLTMLRLLESGRKYTKYELADILEVNPRMIAIYKEELEKSGIYIDTIRGKYGGYIYHQKHNYNISFDYLDVDAIESILDKLDNKERDKLSITLEKIRAIVIYSTDEGRYPEIKQDEINHKYKIISKAIQNNEILEFDFHKKRRKFIPYSFTYYKNYVYVTGLELNHNDIKTLNLLGIENLD